jgi:hypothetical protein
MVCPKLVIGYPLIGRVTKHLFRFFTDKSKLEAPGIGFPDNTINGINKRVNSLVCLYDLEFKFFTRC